MRVIYLDTLLAVNLFIDYILLCVTKNILHINTKHGRLIISASVGSLLSLCVFIPIYSIILSAFIKIATALIITIIAYGIGSFRKTLIRSITFMGISMILSTAVVLINNLVKPTGVIVYKDVIYFDISPKVLVISTGLLYLVLSLYHRFLNTHRIKSSTHKITMIVEDKEKLTFESALDTGCNLKEPFSGLPVILTEESLIKNVSPDKNKMRIIPFSTVAGSDIILGFKPTYLEIDGKEFHKGCYIGICKDKLRGEIKSIMGSELLEVI